MTENVLTAILAGLNEKLITFLIFWQNFGDIFIFLVKFAKKLRICSKSANFQIFSKFISNINLII